LAKKANGGSASAARAQTANDDIGEAMRLRLYRSQYVIRQAEQRAYDLFLQNLVKGTSHLSCETVMNQPLAPCTTSS
jgi:hypothetical protein